MLRAEEEILQQTGKRMRIMILPPVTFDKSLDIFSLQRVICSALDMLPADCFNRLREGKYVHLRALNAYFLKQYFPDATLKGIGKMIGNVDHTTVIHYCNMVTDLIDRTDAAFMPKYEAVLQAVTQWAAQDIIELPGKKPKDMVKVIAELWGMNSSEYRAHIQREDYVELRRVIALCLNEFYPYLTHKDIGELLGDFDHSTVQYYISRAKDFLEVQDKTFTEMYNRAYAAASEWLKSKDNA